MTPVSEERIEGSLAPRQALREVGAPRSAWQIRASISRRWPSELSN